MSKRIQSYSLELESGFILNFFSLCWYVTRFGFCVSVPTTVFAENFYASVGKVVVAIGADIINNLPL
jgi:hypothetical protein